MTREALYLVLLIVVGLLALAAVITLWSTTDELHTEQDRADSLEQQIAGLVRERGDAIRAAGRLRVQARHWRRQVAGYRAELLAAGVTETGWAAEAAMGLLDLPLTSPEDPR